ncbi:MAG: hypothetical protein ACREAA_19095 [Candidatus Polarisedimenticolia bacterium]
MLGKLFEADRIEFENHVVGCHACAARVTRLDEALGLLERHVQESRPVSGVRRVWVGAAALAAGILLIVTLTQRQPETPQGTGAIEPRRSAGGGGIDLVAPLGEIGAPPVDLVWSAHLGVSQCRATIALPDLTPVWSGPSTSEVSAAVPEEVGLSLQRSSGYLWKVSCRTADGERESSYGEFRIRPGP